MQRPPFDFLNTPGSQSFHLAEKSQSVKNACMVTFNVVNFVSLVSIFSTQVKEKYMGRIVSIMTLSAVFALSFGLDAHAATTKADVASYDLANGKAVYDANCAACHGAGIMGAPKTGTARKWTSRLTQSLDTMIQKSIAGYSGDYRGTKTFMPAKGGNPDLTDQEVGNSVAYMVNEVL